MRLSRSLALQALIHGLNRHYYSIAIDYRKNELEEQMLMNLHKNTWSDGLVLSKFEDHAAENEKTVKVGVRDAARAAVRDAGVLTVPSIFT